MASYMELALTLEEPTDLDIENAIRDTGPMWVKEVCLVITPLEKIYGRQRLGTFIRRVLSLYPSISISGRDGQLYLFDDLFGRRCNQCRSLYEEYTRFGYEIEKCNTMFCEGYGIHPSL